MVEAVGAVPRDRLGVNEIDRCLFGYELCQSGCRIDIEAGADDDEKVGLLTVFHGRLNGWHRFAKPDNEGPQLAARFGITSIPTLILFRNGKPEKSTVGYQKKESLEKLL